MEEKIRSGKRRHKIRTVGNPSGKIYITKYVVDLDVLPKITEIHIYAGEDGKVHIPEEYRSVVVYGANVKTLAVALYSEGVMANDRITGFLNGACVGMLGLSAGNVYGFGEVTEKHLPSGRTPLESESCCNGCYDGDRK